MQNSSVNPGSFNLGDVRIRACRDGDVALLHAVHSAAVRTLCASCYTPDQIDGWLLDDSDERYQVATGREAVLLVAEYDANVCAFGAVDLGIAQLKSLFVHPGVAGHGVGSGLLRCLEREALAAGVDELDVDASLNAVSFYERHGYQRGPECIFTFSSGMRVPCISMHKRLPEWYSLGERPGYPGAGRRRQ